ncbi:3-oxoacyl-ACP reductase family protein [Saccharibacillus sp. CPCC 101409]|uniref:3-oxoacyl-ACP reductase family protein n=1 Tax=Saccharibacillus sp. CPCC 101409 TaxID=3058041 RepID=UPI002670FC8A|nr:3-oxoacyl-ACP reductase family protein [Saccharibacillus sp. CPCC 101409]MDO3410452.1 3-oxoacyl-ACP reductase family protein [Saccharibacillus sp. CPCC 101409]
MNTTQETHKPLAGKVALVTGGARGIGAAIVKKLAEDGAAVAFTYVSSGSRAEELVQEIKNAHGRALAVQADSADPEALDNAVQQTLQSLGSIDILVNNAAGIVQKSYDQVTLEEFDQVMNLNVRAVFAAARIVGPQMRPGGRIINIGSISAERNPFPQNTPYVTSKAAVAGLTRALARDLAPQGVTVNNIQPGMIDTDSNPADDSKIELIKSLVPLGRYGNTAEIADLAAYLASPAAGYVTGASLNIDGGFNI